MSHAAILSAFIINLFEYGTFKSYGVFFEALVDDYGVNYVVIASWIALSRASMNVFCLFSHWLCHKLGIKSSIIIGGIIVGSTLTIASCMTNVSWYGCFITISAFFVSVIYISSVIIIQQTFPDDTVKILGYTSAGGAVGMMIFPPIVEFLIELYGWRGSFLLMGAVNFHLIICGMIIVPNHVQKPKLEKSKYNEINDKDDCAEVTETIMDYLNFYFINNPRFVPVLIASALNGFVFNGWTVFLVPHGISKGLSLRNASFLSFSGGIGTLLGRSFIGPIMNIFHLTSTQYMIIIALVNMVTFCMDIFASTFWFLAVLAFINGFVTTSLPIVIFGAIAEVIGDARAVEGYTFAWVIYGIGDFIGGFILGLLLDIGSDMLFLTLGGISLATALAMGISNERHTCCRE